MSEVTRVLGVDPGLRVMGWGVVERSGPGFRLVDSGTIRPKTDDPIAARLACLHSGLTAVIDAHRPQAAAVEEAFGGKNIRSAIRLGEARSVALLAAHQGGCDVHEVPPALVKKAVAGHGRAGKDAVRHAVLRALGIDPDADAARPFDETDAMALALTALVRLPDADDPLLGGLPIGRRRGGGRKRRGSRRWTASDLQGLIGPDEPT